MLQRAVERGHSIGKIARLTTGELATLVANHSEIGRAANHSSNNHAASIRGQMIEAIERFDGPGLEKVMQDALVSLGHSGLLRHVIAPLAHEIGERWRSGELTAAHEHFFTASVKMFLGELTRHFATPLNAPRIIVSTPTGQVHELGAIMAAATAANLGWRPVYLGPSLPAHEIAGAMLRNEASAVALSIVYPEDDPNIEVEIAELSRLIPANTHILVGGRAACAYMKSLVQHGVLHADNIEQFADLLDALRKQPAVIRK